MHVKLSEQLEENQKLHNVAFYNTIRAGDEDIAFGKTEAFTSELMKGIKQQAKKNLENGTLTNSPESLPE